MEELGLDFTSVTTTGALPVSESLPRSTCEVIPLMKTSPWKSESRDGAGHPCCVSIGEQQARRRPPPPTSRSVGFTPDLF